MCFPLCYFNPQYDNSYPWGLSFIDRGEREKERQTDREGERQTGRQREKQRQRDIQTDRQKQMDKQTDQKRVWGEGGAERDLSYAHIRCECVAYNYWRSPEELDSSRATDIHMIWIQTAKGFSQLLFHGGQIVTFFVSPWTKQTLLSKLQVISKAQHSRIGDSRTSLIISEYYFVF